MEIINLKKKNVIREVLVLEPNEVETIANILDFARTKREKKDYECEKVTKDFLKYCGHFVIERKRELRRSVNEQG